MIDKRPHLGGNIYCEEVEGIQVHKYGAHIFHTSNKKVWDFVNSIVEFNRYTNCPVANYKGELYNLPFNMNTFYQLWGVKTPVEAQAKIEEQRMEAIQTLGNREPQNLEEQALCLVGKDILRGLLRNIQRNNGDALAKSCQLSSFADYQYAWYMTIIISTINIRVFLSEDIIN